MKRILAIAAGLSLGLGAALAVAFGIQIAVLERSVDLSLRARDDAPSRLLSRPLVLRRGAQLGSDSLEAHLAATGYRRVEVSPGLGEYALEDGLWRIGRRGFEHPASNDPAAAESAGTVEVALAANGRVSALRAPSGGSVRTLPLEPAVIGAFRVPDGRDRRRVPLTAVPSQLVDAVLAIEDQRFYEHGGLDLRRIAGALWANWKAGRVVQGGSTLTQQLVKNLYLTRERSLWRKLQEVPLAVLLEWSHDKQEILAAYLNEAYLGQDGGVAIHGVGRAAEHWFGRPVEALRLHESALLAGMLRGPSLYSPRRAPEIARERRDLVLAEMHRLGMIDEAARRQAAARDLGVVPRRRIPRSVRYFDDAIAPELVERLGEETLSRAGLRIHTSLDLRLQRLAERAVRRGVERLEAQSPALVREDSPLQAALVALDARSGQVLAMVGGRSYGSTQFNRATDARRQPGSVFKPVAALAALTPSSAEAGHELPSYTLATLVRDEPLVMETDEGDWEPGNHDDEFRGPVTLREVIEHSLNVPMIRIGMTLGPRRVVRAARRLGIESPLRGVPSLVLGTSEVTLLEMTRAYGVLAAEGWRAELLPVRSVRSADGELLERFDPEGRRALDRAEAHLLTSLLEGVVNRGTGYGVREAGYRGPVAGKTGTTDDYRDAWFIGYVPDLVVGVWVGFDDGRTLRHSGSRAALPIFAEFLKQSLGLAGGRGFRTPPGIETAPVVAAEGYPAGLRCGDRDEVFLAGTAPRERCAPWHWLTGLVVQRDPDTPPDVAGGPAEPREPRRRLRLRLPPWLNPLFGRAEAQGSAE